MIGASSIFTAYHVQYLLLESGELRAKCAAEDAARYLVCVVVFLAALVFQ